MRQLLVSPYPEEARLAPSWPAGVAGDGKNEKTVPMEAIGSILAGDREGKMEILAHSLWNLTFFNPICAASSLMSWEAVNGSRYTLRSGSRRFNFPWQAHLSLTA